MLANFIKKSLMILMIYMAVVSMGVFSEKVYADDGYVWFGDSSYDESGDGGGSGGGDSSDGGSGNIWDNHSSQQRCDSTTVNGGSSGVGVCGHSWIFFKSTGKWSGDLEFRPIWDSANNISIPSDCTKNTDKNGGFWHLGRNAIGRGFGPSFGNNGFYDFIGAFIAQEYQPFAYLNGNKKICPTSDPRSLAPYCEGNYAYQSQLESFGHAATYTIKQARGKGVYQSAPGGRTSVNQTLYAWDKNKNEWVAAYEATKVSPVGVAGSGEAWESYVKAYQTKNNTSEAPTNWPDNLYAFCYDDGMGVSEYTLTVNSVDTKGNALGTGPKTDTVKSGEKAEVKIDSIKDYHKIKWCFNSNLTNCTNSLDMTYTENALTSNKTVYAVFEKNTFEGSIKVGDKSVGFTSESKIGATYFINNCNSISGCQVTFTHAMKRIAGIGNTTYRIARVSNYSKKDVGNNNNLKSGEGSDLSYLDGPLTLYPGQMVCETLTFKPHGNQNESDTTLKICAAALGNGQPSETDGAEAFIDMQVKNNDGEDEYQSYQKIVYAKPLDNLTYRASYNPVLQYLFYIDEVKAKLLNFRNAFAVHSEGLSYSHNYIYNNGDTTPRRETNDYKVPVGAVGSELKEIAETNYNSKVSTTPTQINFRNAGSSIESNISSERKTSFAIARVPYNFVINIDKQEEPEDLIVDAGIGGSVEYSVVVEPKTNIFTSKTESYATIVRDAKTRIIVYAPINDMVDNGYDGWKNDNICEYFGRSIDGENCRYLYDEQTDLNTNGLFAGTESSIRASMQEDLPAGSKVCVAAAVYPSNSGADNNLDKNGSRTWKISESTCYTVAKKPTFQVWGGGIYAEKNIATYTTTKSRLTGSAVIEDGVLVFGSWAEQAVVSNGNVTGLSSGAATGLADNVVGGGSLERMVDYCKNRVPLNLANYGLSLCPYQQVVGQSGIIMKPDFEKLFEVPGVENINDNIAINEMNYFSGNRIIKVSGNIYIRGNIIYAEDSYTKLRQMPKMVLYTNQNINIDCNVNRIDAILIAKGTINTCADDAGVSPGIDAEARSNQLVINGAIFAKELKLERTYGMGIGAYSKIPAEIINYDTSILLWDKNVEEEVEFEKVHQVYMHELAPRY